MIRLAKRGIRRLVRRFGYDFVARRSDGLPLDFDDAMVELCQRVSPYTMTSPERLWALREAVRYVVRCDIRGDIVECGVWKGGSMMAAALTLHDLGVTNRRIHLFDTFEGMSAPSSRDRSVSGEDAADLLRGRDKDYWLWCRSPLEDVREAMRSTRYDESNLMYISGRVEDTLPGHAPDKIALLRLDTDWYESTYHEMTHLFPRLVPGGVLILDDYGHWEGAREAVDQYLSETKAAVLLQRIDESGRICVKRG